MRCKHSRLFSLFFVLMLLAQLAACGGGSGTNIDPAATFPVVVFSDVHFNPFYDTHLFSSLVTADPSQWADIFRTSPTQTASMWGNDSNYPLLVLALASVRQNLGTSPLIIFTGDILVHSFDQTFYQLYDPPNAQNPTPADVAAMKAFTNKTIAFFAQQVRSIVGNRPVMFAVGNNDSYSDVGPDATFLSSNAESYYTQFLNGSVDHQAFLTTFEAGGYYSAEPTGTNLVVIGLNTVLFSPAPPGSNIGPLVDAQLAWFESTLASAQARGKKVWLLMHIPPGANILAVAQSFAAGNRNITSAMMMWDQDSQTNFLRILATYPGLITMSLAAHTHMDEYRIMSAGNMLDLTPSISARSGNNPAFRVHTISRDTLASTGYTTLNYDLASPPGEFNSFYTFSTAYSMQGPLDDSLAVLYPTLATDSAKQAIYRANYFSGRPYDNSFNPITDVTWPVFWCGIGNMGQADFTNCVNTY